jgi:hypothetical protein
LTATTGASSIALAWSAVAGAASYNVYRGTVAGAETLLAAGVTGTTFKDLPASNAATFFYVVTAVNANVAPLANESARSNEVSATLPLAANYTSSPPATWYVNQSLSYTITVTNLGTQTWNATGTNAVRLGVYFGGSSDAVGAWPAEPKRYNLPFDVAPGQSATLTVKIAAPATGGSYTLRNRLVKENVSWFSSLQKTSVFVNQLSAGYVASPPIAWAPGVSQSYMVTVTNTGNVTWNASGANPVHLGVYFGGTSDAIGAWTVEPKRVALPNDVLPGASVTLTATITAPAAPGTYVLRERMVKEQVAWFSDMLRTTVTVASTASATVNPASATTAAAPPTVYLAAATGGPPAQAAAGASLTFSLTLLNSGADVWKSIGKSQVRVAAYWDLATAAPSSLSATPAVSVNLASDVSVRGKVTLPLHLTAPRQKGAYMLRVRLIGSDGAFSDFVLQSLVQIH